MVLREKSVSQNQDTRIGGKHKCLIMRRYKLLSVLRVPYTLHPYQLGKELNKKLRTLYKECMVLLVILVSMALLLLWSLLGGGTTHMGRSCYHLLCSSGCFVSKV